MTSHPTPLHPFYHRRRETQRALPMLRKGPMRLVGRGGFQPPTRWATRSPALVTLQAASSPFSKELNGPPLPWSSPLE